MPRTKKNTKVATAATTAVTEYVGPKFIHEAEATVPYGAQRTRAYQERFVNGLIPAFGNHFPNLVRTPTPFQYTSDYTYCDTREAVRICVKAYWAFALLRNTIEVMVELANGKIVVSGGNKSSRDLVEAWLNRIAAPSLSENFFREWWRSGNWFALKQYGNFSDSDLARMKQVFGSEVKREIPVSYVTLNPENITCGGDLSLNQPAYYKILTPYELKQIKSPETDPEKMVVRTLGNTKELNLTAATSTNTYIPLDPTKLAVLLYKAQDYDPMGVPMAFGVLGDIEAKLELKRIDLSIARATDRAMLLITVGETPTEYNPVAINPTTQKMLQEMFANESVARTLIADYTVKAEWLIPEINKILGPEKYVQIDKDISSGINAFLFNDTETFANTSIKVEVFVKRLKEAREAFINEFLQPEIISLCKAVGTKSYPTVAFEDISLKDELQYSKLAVNMFQLGLLTPEETMEMMKTGKIPTPEESVESQETFKEYRGQGLYMPIIGGATQLQSQQLDLQDKQIEYTNDIQQQQVDTQKQQADTAEKVAVIKAKQPPAVPGAGAKNPVKKSGGGKSPGRPQGSKAPQSSKKVSPMGSKASLEDVEETEFEYPQTGFSLAALQKNFYSVSNLQNKVDKKLRRKFGLKELSEQQISVSKSLVTSIIANEPEDKWLDAADEYLITPKEISIAAASEIDDISIRHNVDEYTAAVLRLTQRDAPNE